MEIERFPAGEAIVESDAFTNNSGEESDNGVMKVGKSENREISEVKMPISSERKHVWIHTTTSQISCLKCSTLINPVGYIWPKKCARKLIIGRRRNMHVPMASQKKSRW